MQEAYVCERQLREEDRSVIEGILSGLHHFLNDPQGLAEHILEEAVDGFYIQKERGVNGNGFVNTRLRALREIGLSDVVDILELTDGEELAGMEETIRKRIQIHLPKVRAILLTLDSGEISPSSAYHESRPSQGYMEQFLRK